jgi:serine/threonine protein kinase
MADIIGQVILSQYRVDSFVAAGGMGAVYRVWDLKRSVPLAMKVLHSELAEDPSVFKRFQREGRALQKLAHPNIVPFYGLYQTADFAFMLERFVDGPALKEVLKRRKGQPLPMQETLTYMKALCAALGYAHANGVVHCDVKPGNVITDNGGNIYLTDFGIARHAESSTTTMGAAGTSAYMPPEQILGEAVTAATDVYALGVILYEMLTGRRPFRGTAAGTDQSSATLNVKIRQEQLHSQAVDPRELVPGIPQELAQVVLKALSKAPAERYASAPQFFAAISKAAGVDPTSISERAPSVEVSEARDYSVGHEVLPGASPQSAPVAHRSPALITGLVVAGILGCVAIAAVGVLAFRGKGASASELPNENISASIVSPVSIPATETNVPPPPATNTPDHTLMTAAAVLTQAAALPTATKTPSGPNCPGNEIGSIKEVYKNDVMLLEICSNNKITEIGNLAYGISRVGPNKKFFVYITLYGDVYVARVGNVKLNYLTKIKFFTMIKKDDVPNLEITFLGDHPYKLYVKEHVLNQNETIAIPRMFTSPSD